MRRTLRRNGRTVKDKQVGLLFEEVRGGKEKEGVEKEAAQDRSPGPLTVTGNSRQDKYTGSGGTYQCFLPVRKTEGGETASLTVSLKALTNRHVISEEVNIHAVH